MILVTCAVLPGYYTESHDLKLDAEIKKNSQKTHNCTTKKYAA